MSEMRRDPLTGRWVVFAPERKRRPLYIDRPHDGFESSVSGGCPFCKGNEDLTPPEVLAYRGGQSKPNQEGWSLRVVPNKFPALRVEGELGRRPDGFYDRMNNIGAHEVVIETPSHHHGIDDMTLSHVKQIFCAYKARLLDLKQDCRFRYIKIFKNHGAAAGATIPHSHSQIIALPVVPSLIEEKIHIAQEHFRAKERCLCCDIISHERDSGQRMLWENEHFVVLAPYASRFPFELTLYPTQHQSRFEELDDALLDHLAHAVKNTVERLNRVLDNPDYHWILTNAPFGGEVAPYFHWYLEIIPLVTGTGGFELGTQSYINTVYPEEAVEILKDLKYTGAEAHNPD